MAAITAQGVTVKIGHRVILDSVSLSIDDRERVGVVGRNGGGKSTLLRAIAGEVKPDEGRVAVSRGRRVSFVRQDAVFEPGISVHQAAAAAFEHVQSLHTELHRVFDAMATAEGPELEELLATQEHLEHEIEAAGSADIHRVEEVLFGVGFVEGQFEQPAASLSGGQKGRLSLAKAILEAPDVMLLDEPTNHLDIDGRLWLESFLRDEYKGAVVVISHDRYLLDNVVHRIVEVEPVPGRGGRLHEYPGNYAKYRELRVERREAMMRAWEKQQTEWKKEEEFIRRYKAGQRAKQAQGRLSRLERAKEESTLERPLELAQLRMDIPRAERTGDVVASARGITKRYTRADGTVLQLFNGLDLTIARGERWAVVGPNGAGKSTLVKCLLGELAPDAGQVNLGAKLSIGYYRQSHDHVPPDKTVIEYLQAIVRVIRPSEGLSEQAARNLAGAFMFSGEDQDKLLGVLSGGERSRAVLAGLFVAAKNVLVLDEPTNHLDIPSAERLEQILALPKEDPKTGERTESAFDGTLILISHDRALIDATCNKILMLHGDGRIEVFPGNWTEYQRHKREAAAREAETEAKRAAARAKQAPPAPKAAMPANKAEAAGPRPAAPPSRPEPAPAPVKAPPAPAKPVAAPAPAKPVAAPAREQPAARTVVPAPKPDGKLISGPRPAGGGKSRFSWMPIERIDERLKLLQPELAELDRKLDDPDVWLDHERANKLVERRDEVREEVEALEEEWLRKSG